MPSKTGDQNKECEPVRRLLYKYLNKIWNPHCDQYTLSIDRRIKVRLIEVPEFKTQKNVDVRNCNLNLIPSHFDHVDHANIQGVSTVDYRVFEYLRQEAAPRTCDKQ